jgi:hypothetical protein
LYRDDPNAQVVRLFYTLPISLPMLSRNWPNFMFFKSPNRGLFCLRANVGVLLKHLIAKVACERSNDLLRDFGTFREPSNEGMS